MLDAEDANKEISEDDESEDTESQEESEEDGTSEEEESSHEWLWGLMKLILSIHFWKNV